MSEKNKSIIGIMLIITVLAGVFFYWGVRIYMKIMDAKIIDTANRTTLLTDNLIQNTLNIYKIRIKEILNDKMLITAFYEKNRGGLYRLALKYHNNLKAENSYYSNMHFHLPEGRSFLRMHKPDEYGDDLRNIRPIIVSVHETKSCQHGSEIGKHGIFFRLAYPLFYNQEYIGALELGLRVEEIAKNIEKVLGVQVARIIDGKNLETAFREFPGKDEIIFQNQYINAYNHHDFFADIISSFNFKDPSPQRVKKEGSHFILFPSGELKDFKKRTIAGFLVAQDISREMSEFHIFIRNSLFLFFALLACAHILLHFSFGAMVEKIFELNRTLEARVRERTKSLEEMNKEVLHANAELNQVINTAADGMRIIDKNYNVLRVNDTFVKLMGKSKEALENRPCHEWSNSAFCFSPQCTLQRILNGEKRVEIDVEREVGNDEYKSFLLTATPYKSLSGKILGVVENFRDITDIKRLLDKQAVDIDKAKSILSIVNDDLQRYTYIENRCRIFAGAISVPCNAEGGDHFFIRNIKGTESGGTQSFISIKDQSGHEVNCILRSIYTDLIHNDALHHMGIKSPGDLAALLNNELCYNPFFELDDFFTSINARLDHKTLMMTYVCSGHPPFLLIRDSRVLAYPSSASGNSLPIPFIANVDFKESDFQLKENDQLIFYTDGLTEMTFKKTGSVLKTDELIEITQSIIENYSGKHLQAPSVSELMNSLLEHICRLSGEIVTPAQKGIEFRNTSPDDITLLGIELEPLNEIKQKDFFFEKTEDISRKINVLQETIFSESPSHLFQHAKKNIWLVLEEGILNAWEHGNKRNPKIPVTVRWQFKNDLTIEIIDQGEGFDLNSLPDPTRPENILKTSGRGIFIIYHFADHVQFEKSGCHLITAFERNSLNEKIKQKRRNPVRLWQTTE